MAFQAYLDAFETKTGKTPRELLAEAEMKGFAADTKAASSPSGFTTTTASDEVRRWRSSTS